MLDRYLVPLAPYALLAFSAVVGLLIFVSVEREIRRLKSGLKRQKDRDLSSQDELQLRLDDLTARLRDAEDRYNMPLSPSAPKPGMSPNKRNQVIRMSRRGQSAETIAASLNMSRKEVELLLKIHGMTLVKTAETPS